MVACTPIPFLDIFCDIVGGAAETVFQGKAAIEGAKSAVESIIAASAHGKERTNLLIAVEKHEEAAGDTAKAEEYESMSRENIEKAKVEEEASEAMRSEGGEAEVLGEEKKEESEREESMAALEEEVKQLFAAL